MGSDRRWKLGSVGAFLGLMMVNGSIEAGHVGSRDIVVPQAPALLHSSGLQVETAADETCTVDPAKELFITDVSVVDDCYRTTWTENCPAPAAPATRGAWTFARIAEGLFGTQDPKLLSKQVRQWLKLWIEDDIVNGDLVPARPAMRDLILRPWEQASGGPVLDMKKAPFRLLAIVPRMDVGVPDLQHLDAAGEFRMIYGVLDEHGEPTPFTMIFEYKIVSDSCETTLDFAHGFNALSSMDFGPGFNAALQAMTDRIITPGAAPGYPNGSPLVGLRTNEAFLGSPWEMRSFALAVPEDDEKSGEAGQGGGTLKPKARLVHQPQPETPAARYQGTQTLADFITEFAPQLFDRTLRYPLTYRGEPFLAGVAHNSLDLGWGGPEPFCTSAPRVPRRLFSVITCQGCHGNETATPFLHVTPRRAGEPSQLSKLLKGPFHVVRDQCNVGLGFADIERRKNFQCFLLSQTCPE